MPKYQTLDQIVKWKGERIPPYTEVTVASKDRKIWDRLVQIKVAAAVPTDEVPAEKTPDDAIPES